MITLNTNQGLVRIQTWEEVETAAGFTAVLDPKASPLKSILGSYAFPDRHPCGLSSCRTGHGMGYLVQTARGEVTNIGHQCGEKHFSVTFTRMAKAYERDLRAKEQREDLVALQHRVPELLDRIEAMKAGPTGATWIVRTLTGLKERTHGLPERVLARVNALVRARDGTLTVGREATPEEVAQLRARGQRVGPGPTYVDDVVGHLDGLAALYPQNDLRDLLVKRTSTYLQDLAGLDIATLPDKHRKTLAKDVLDIEPALAQAAEAIAQGQRLLTKANIGQLAEIAHSKEDRRQVLAFAGTLP